MSRDHAVTILLALGLVILATDGSVRAQTCRSDQIPYTFINYCPFPIWLGEYSTTATQSYPPASGSWEIAANNGSTTVCGPQTWISSRFWPRTGCTLDSQGHLNCATGQCGGAGEGRQDCGFGSQGVTGNNPQTLVEVTTTLQANGLITANYDVSLASGNNVETYVQALGRACESNVAGCTADLNASCPAALRLTVPTTTTPTAIPCGSGTYCPAGTCVAETCVVGCLTPFDACQLGTPEASLACATPIPGVEPYTDCHGKTGSTTYQDMYGAKNTADGHAQASPNQGSPTCFADVDCPPVKPSCVTSGFVGVTPPTGAGVCLTLEPNQAAINDFTSESRTCSAATVRQPCGGYLDLKYPEALGYTCQPVTYTMTNNVPNTAYTCLPSTTSGLGTCQTAPDPTQPALYTGVAGVFNEAWLTAGLQAGANGTPYYAIFKEACPLAYTWQYDDIASDYGCGSITAFNIAFCPQHAD